ncbi:hypothetical protein HGA88_02965 [Candidatus Roizmanbacteria bacterium]|nr:hypothetical protein [Candidatus Roizmanbacteria bacterium]
MFGSLLNKNNHKKNVYFGLFLHEHEAVGFIYEEKNGEMHTLDKQKVSYSNGFEQLAEDIDELLFGLEKTTSVHVEQVIYFLYSSFIDAPSGDIKQPYKSIIKSLSKSLELKPLGYIECHEAVSRAWQKKESLPLNAILLELDKTNFGLFVYKSGKLLFQQTAARTNHFMEDILEVLSQLKGQILPSRIILYDSTALDSEAQAILSHKWQTDLFVQPPRPEIMKEEEVYSNLRDIFSEQIMDATGEVREEDEEEQEYFGNEEESIPSEPEPAKKQDVLGFVMNEDIHKTHPTIHADSKVTPPLLSDKPISAASQRSFGFPKLPTLTIKVPKLNLSFSKLSLIVGLVLIVSALFILEFFFHKVRVTAYLPTQELTQEIPLALSLDKPNDSFDIQTATISSHFTSKKTTTGQRAIGDSARGEVTVHNFDDTTRVIEKGTTLTVNGLAFVTDSDIKVASSSENIINGEVVKEAGKAKTTVTASAIGTESNIGANQRLKIGNLSSSLYFAINEKAFTGGSKKQVQTVTKKDYDDLKQQVLDQAKTKMTADVSQQGSDEKKVLDGLTTFTLGKTTFSKEIGEDAAEVALDAVVSAEYYAYQTSEVKHYLKTYLQTQVQTGYKLSEDGIHFTMSQPTVKNDKVSLTLSVKSVASKDIPKEEIIAKITGKSKGDVEKILKNTYMCTGYEIKNQGMYLPDNILWLPFFKQNIDLRFTSL